MLWEAEKGHWLGCLGGYFTYGDVNLNRLKFKEP